MPFLLQTQTLQHLAQVKTVTQLWNQRYIFTQIAESFSSLPTFEISKYEQKWKEIEEKVTSKVWALPLPETCIKELLNFIKPIGMEIINWCRYHNPDDYSFQFLGSLLPQQFCWTMHGTIDYAKTAALTMKDEILSVERRFEFASLNCLEDEALALIKLIPNHQKYITEAVDRKGCRWIMEQRILTAYFACTLSGDQDLLDRLFQAMDLGTESINEYLFSVALYRGSRSTCEYFLQKVSQPEKEQVYLKLPFRPARSPTCGSMYYLSLMIEERRVQHLLRESTDFLLTLLLRWPMQPLFLETAKRAWPCIDSDDCAEVLGQVIDKIRDGFQDYDYTQWFWELWRLSPAEYKHDFLNDIYQLTNLILTKRKDFIQLVFNEAPSYLLSKLVKNRQAYEDISQVLTDESVISDAALMECKETAELNCLKDRGNIEKLARSHYLSRLADIVMENRKKIGVTTS